MKQRNRSDRDMDGRDDTHELQPIKTIQDAVQCSLKKGCTDTCLFTLARALKAFEVNNGQKLSSSDLDSSFTAWWSAAKAHLPEGASFDEYRFVFLEAFKKAKTPLGSNVLANAIVNARKSPPPPISKSYKDPRISLLIGVCWQLQLDAKTQPFFIGTRGAASILGTKNLMTASAVLKGLVSDGVLKIVTSGKQGGNRATRFIFTRLLPITNITTESSRVNASNAGLTQEDSI